MSHAVALRVRLDAQIEAHGRTLAAGALGAILGAAAVVLLYAGRHLTFFYDEWDFILGRRGGGLHTYLDPHNGHLSLIPVLVYKVLFKLVGLRHYTAYRAVSIAVQLICAYLLYVLGRRRIGPWLALAPVTLLLFMGTAFQDQLWPFQIGYLGSLAAGLGALALLEDRARHWADARAGVTPTPPARDGWIAALLACSLASSGVGVCFVLATAVTLIAQREPWRRLWVPVLPAVLYVLWSIGWSAGDTTTANAILGAPQYVANAVAGVAAGMAGLDAGAWGPPLAVGLFGAVVLTWRFHRGGLVTPMLLAALVGGFSFWVLTALTRAGSDEPAASRYLYVGAVFVWLVLLEVSAGLRLRPGWLGLGAVMVVAALVSNLQALRAGEVGLRVDDTVVRATLAAADVARPVVSPAFVPSPADAPQITAGAYFAAAHDLGSPAFTLGELERQLESVRAQADQALSHGEEITVLPAPAVRSASGASAVPSASGAPAIPSASGGPAITGATRGHLAAAGSCERFDPAPGGGYADLSAHPGQGLLVRPSSGSAAVVYLRRFASGFDSGPLGTVGGRGGVIRFPLDRAPGLPWGVRVGAHAPVLLCTA